jgi:glutamate carboxypeptidase
MDRLIAFCTAEEPWLLDTIERLARLESPTTDKAAVDRCGAEAQALIESIGGRVRRLPRHESGDHLMAEWGGGGPRVLLLGHLDTVWPVGQLARMPLRRAAGRLYGPGVLDMKGGVAIGLLAIRAVREAGGDRRNVAMAMLLTSDEEMGSRTSRAVIEEAAARSAAVLVLEPALPGGAVKTRRPACGEYLVEIRGRAAHAGSRPRGGASAILELARQVLALEAMNDPAREISVTVGTIAGGTRTNVVPESARAGVDVRVMRTEDASEIQARFAAMEALTPGTSLSVTGGIERPPFERTPGVARLLGLAREAAAELGEELQEGATGGGSDGNFTAALGVPTLDGLGACGEGAHAIDEHVEIRFLPRRAALLAGLIARIGAG